MKKIVLFISMLTACDKLHSDASTSSSTSTPTATVTANEILTATTTATATATATATVTAMATASAAGNWPSYLADYPGAKVTKKTKDFESLETKDSPDKVVAFYKDKLKAAGFPPGPWASLASANGKDQPTVMTASKGSDMVQVTVTPIQGTTKISLSIM
jgi:hypothetical protein